MLRAAAALVAVWSVAKISLSPPRLTPRALEIASATTVVVVDTPISSVLDLRQNTYDFQALTQRAVLLGNVIANGTVRQAIAARVHIPVTALQVAVRRPRSNRAPNPDREQPSVGDITKSTNQYQLSIQVNPTVPILDIYAEAPMPDRAATLANAAVDGLHDYLAQLGADPADSVPGPDPPAPARPGPRNRDQPGNRLAGRRTCLPVDALIRVVPDDDLRLAGP